MYESELQNIKATLGLITSEAQHAVNTVKATLIALADAGVESVEIAPAIDEHAKLLPYVKQTNTPTGFPWGEYSLKEAADLRKIKASMEKLNAVDTKIDDANDKFKAMRVETEAKIAKEAEAMGLEKIKKEQMELTKKLSETVQEEFKAVEESLGESKKLLFSLKESVYTVYTKVTEKKVEDSDKLEAVLNAMNKLLAPELVEAINKAADQSIEQIKQADKKMENVFISWKAPKDMRKKIKEELPKDASLKTAGIFETLKGWVSDLVSSIKGFFSPVEDSASELQSTLEQTEPMVNELNELSATL